MSVDSSLSASSASANIDDDDIVRTVDEDIWQGQDYQNKIAI